MFGDGHLSGAAASLVALDVMLLTLVAVVGLLLVRSRWARYLGTGVLLGELALVPALERGAGTIVVAALAAVSLVIVGGPWLAKSLQHHPAAGGPPLPAVVLLIGLLTLPTIAGLASPGGVEPGHIILAVAGPVMAWWLGRAHQTGLWAARFGLPIAAAGAAVASPLLGAIAIVIVAAALTVLAWRRDIHIAVSPLAPLPGGSYRIPPELAPPEILGAAGLDDRGRRKS